ncbi:MAG: glycosyltransferase [Candidatus Glassbacteria bacterium]
MMECYADLHCHSKFSNRPSQFYLKLIGARESYTEPEELYARLKSRGMDLVTITDHDTIEGVLQIAHNRDVFISEELSCFFPEDGCKVHILVFNINEDIHRDLLKLKENIYELSYYLYINSIAHSVAHPLFRLNGILDASHIERLLLLFENFEQINGGRARTFNRLISLLLEGMTTELMEQLAEKHEITPVGKRPWRRGITGGSDDHTGLLLGSTWTSVEGASDAESFLKGLTRYSVKVGGVDGTSTSLAHSIYHGCYHFLKDKVFKNTPKSSELLTAGYITRKILGEDAVRFSLKDGARFIASKVGLKGKKGREDDTLLSISDVKDLYGEIWNKPPKLRGNDEFSELNDRVFDTVTRLSNNLFQRLLHDFGYKFLMGHLSESISAVGSMSSLFTLLVPYMIASSHQNKDRDLLRNIAENFNIDWEHREDKIGWFTDTFSELNGVTVTIKRMAKEAMEFGKEIQVVCSCEGSLDLDVNHRNFPPLGTFSIPGSEYQKIPFPSWLEIMRHCEVEGFTRLVISTPGPVGLSALLASKVLDIKTSGIFHTDIPLYVKIHTENETFEKIAWRYISWFYNSMDTIYIASDYYRSYLIEHGFEPKKMRIFPKAVDIDAFTPKNRDISFWHRWNCDNEIKLLYVGRVVKEKNLDILARSYKKLAKDRDDILLVVVGEGPYREELETILEGESVLFTGALEGDDLTSAYASSDIFVFPSTTDTYGNAVLEAQASGLPAVVTDAGGAQEVIKPDVSGIVTPSMNADAFAQAIQEILKSPSLRNRMSAESRRLAEERHWENAFQRFWNQNTGS